MARLEEPRLTRLSSMWKARYLPRFYPTGDPLMPGPRCLACEPQLYVGAGLSAFCSSPLAEAHCGRRNQVHIDGETSDHDVVIDRGEIKKWKKKPSKEFRDKFGHTPLSI